MTFKWWLSFCDADKPTGSQLLGIALVEAEDIVEAVKVAWAQGCNPGGEVAGACIPEDVPIPPEAMNRLMQREEAESFFGPVTQGPPPEHADTFCVNCNGAHS